MANLLGRDGLRGYSQWKKKGEIHENHGCSFHGPAAIDAIGDDGRLGFRKYDDQNLFECH